MMPYRYSIVSDKSIKSSRIKTLFAKTVAWFKLNFVPEKFGRMHITKKPIIKSRLVRREFGGMWRMERRK